MKNGLQFKRVFTDESKHPFDQLEWKKFDAVITESNGDIVFEQRGIEAPTFWSQTAVNIVASKYFRGHLNSPSRETSVKQLVGRVASRISLWGQEQGYFASTLDCGVFTDELIHILLHQYGSFNSPVWFNIGAQGAKQQASACFINSVDDTMESIMELAATEARLFKGGSGSGVNLSVLRAAGEKLSIGGKASGPISFMRGLDAFAGAVKSGGTTRRAAKMVLLDADHPDILEFIRCKADEEKKAWMLIDAGLDGGFNVPGGAYDSVGFQNANHSVRVTDEFMQSVEAGKTFDLVTRTDAKVVNCPLARDLFREIAQATHICGDPGMQFTDTITKYHTCKNTGPINASNPCSEFVFLDNTACNLASINLLKFDNEGTFNAENFIHTCEIFITAQEILVSNADYPTQKIREMSEAYRPLGLGFCNLGALLMSNGFPYDSPQGRVVAASITAIMTGSAYRQSARIAAVLGAFEGFTANRDSMIEVMKLHESAVFNIDGKNKAPSVLARVAAAIWNQVVILGNTHGFRNAQATVLAPTGTIAFMMDADTTGIEPELALVKYKRLVGGGMIKIINQGVEKALQNTGRYDKHQIEAILTHIEQKDTIEDAPFLWKDDLHIFDCSFKPQNGERSISWKGHIDMMAACQPFISGAISKTVNLPEDCTIEDIEHAYLYSWKHSLKAVAIYRDNSKRTQPLSTLDSSLQKDTEVPNYIQLAIEAGQLSFNPNEAVPDAVKLRLEELKQQNVAKALGTPFRQKLPNERKAITHKFQIADHEGYLTIGLYDNGQPGEIFLQMNKEGSTISGLIDSFAVSTSLALQYGVPLSSLINKFKHSRFEPSGFTQHPDIKIATSLVDYIFRWLELRFSDNIVTEFSSLGVGKVISSIKGIAEEVGKASVLPDGKLCSVCGASMQRAGSCLSCSQCGNSSGCG